MRSFLLRIKHFFRRLWPRHDREMERQCIDAYERGDRQTLDQVIAELRAKVEAAKQG